MPLLIVKGSIVSTEIADPLVELTKKGKKFIWTEACETAFLKLKEALVNPPILAMFDVNRPIHLFCDASDNCVGAVLMREYPEGKRVVEYASNSLRNFQRHWSVSGKESYAILFALRKWRIYIHGRTDVTCWTDHIALCCLTRVNQPRNQRLTRWLMEFLDANVTLQFLNGRLHHATDACSRIFAPELEAPVAKQKYISMESSAKDLMAIQAVGKREELTMEQLSDSFTATIINKIQTGQEYSPEYSYSQQLLWFQDGKSPSPRIVIPKSMVPIILDHYHNSILAGHLGVAKTLKKIVLRDW
jgi:hypothetical protein